METMVAGGRVIDVATGPGGPAVTVDTATIGGILADVRLKARPQPLRQKDLGRRLGILEDRVSRIENNRSPIDLKMFIAWVKHCGHDPAKTLKRYLDTLS